MVSLNIRVFCLYSVFTVLGGRRLEEQIYLDLPSNSRPCFRIMNGTHQFGCNSDRNGNTGVVVYVASIDDLKKLETDYDRSLHLVVAIDLKAFNEIAIRALMQDRIRGILLLNLKGFLLSDHNLSEDGFCPNHQFGLYDDNCKNQWNRAGAVLPEGLRFLDWRKPIFIVTNTTSAKIIVEDCYAAFNKNGSRSGSTLCSAQLTYEMNAAGSSEICMRRQKYYFTFSEKIPTICEPLEDENVIAIVPPPKADADSSNIFILASRMDSFSSFVNFAPGEVSVFTSLIGTIAVAEAIGKHLEEFERAANRSRRSLMFSFFHGESMGYIGSSRTVYDMNKGVFPVELQGKKHDVRLIDTNDIDVFVEIQMLQRAEQLFAHVDGQTYFDNRKNTIDDIIDAANKRLSKFGFNSSLSLLDNLNRSSQLPPSSYQLFLKRKRSIAGFVIAPFSSRYDYRNLNSFADTNADGDPELVKQQISATATAAIGAIVKYIYNDDVQFPDYRINETFISLLYDCFVAPMNAPMCDFLKQITSSDETLQYLGRDTYVSTGSASSTIKLIVTALMVNTLGSKDQVNVSTREQCDDLNQGERLYRHTWQFDPSLNATICYRNSLYLTKARSPAFDLKDYDFKSTEYSTWTESTFPSAAKMRLFLTPPYRAKFDYAIFLAGCAFLVLSFVITEIVYLSNKEFFDPPTPPVEADKHAAPL